MSTFHLVIHGRVQGVWFRESMRREAERLGVAGWVKNLPDGTVEATIQADAATLETMLAWCRIGPPLARVDAIDLSEPSDWVDTLRGFEKRA